MRRHAKAIVAASALLLTLALGVSLASAVAPVVIVDPGSTVSYTSAEVSGEVNPEDHDVYYYFQYSADPVNEGWSNGPQAFSRTLSAGSGASPVSETLTGLKAGTEYQLRLAAIPTDFSESETVSAEPNPTFTTDPVGSPTVSIDPVTTFAGTTAHFSGTIDPEAPVGNPSAFDVNWHFECTPSCPGVEGSIPADSSSHVVEGDASGLEPNKSYEVSLIASNAGGQTTSAFPNPSFTTLAVAPSVTTIPAAFALKGGTKALVAGYVDPQNSPTTYWIEHGLSDCSASLCASIPVSQDADAGAGSSPTLVTQQLTGLSPGTTYHFRLVAHNLTGTTRGQDLTFTSAPPFEGPPGESCPNAELRGENNSTHLPDCRAYEQVSPLDKNNADVSLAGAVAATSGNRLVFKSQGSFAGQPASSSAIGVSYLATRDPSGWSTLGIAPPIRSTDINFDIYLGFTDDLSKGFLQHDATNGFPLVPGALAKKNAYVRDNTNGSFQLASGTLDGVSTGNRATYGGGSADFSHILIQSNTKLTANSPCDPTVNESRFCLYESVNGNLRLASVHPGEVPGFGGAGGGAPDDSNIDHAISDDGSRIFFADDSGDIYMRTDGTSTLNVAESERTPPLPSISSAIFQGAEAAHGNKVLFTTTDQLVDADEDTANDLYMYDVKAPAGHRLTLISLDNDLSAPVGAEVGPELPAGGVMAASDDLRRVYFVASNQIVSGGPTAPGPKLYLWDDTGNSPRTTYIATLDPSDQGDWEWQTIGLGLSKPARVGPGGRYLAFQSSAQLTGYDNTGHKEIYLYDAIDQNIECASCSPEGEPATANAQFDPVGAGLNAGEVPLDHPLQNVTEDGTVFFQTRESLVPRDSNGKTDVYEYSAGEPRLISGGGGAFDSTFLDATPSGDGVFFLTHDRLVGWDSDSNYDVYSARVGGGFPAPPPPPPACEGDACQAPPLIPNDPTPASSSFSGPGNPSGVRRNRHHKKRHRNRHHKKHHLRNHTNRRNG